jgi:VIT1/CCC1 family predicted Fe2+/Mn2+ transporter
MPVYRGKLTGTADSLANRISGAEGAYRRIELNERRHTHEYGLQLRELGDAESIAILKDVIADETAHAKALRRLYRPARNSRGMDPQSALDALLKRRDKGRRRASSWIGDAIYGVNDGLGAIFGIVSGVSGATLNNPHGSKVVLLAGLAGMIASALSMGSGAYLAAKSEREIYEAELQHEREAIKEDPEEAREMLSLYYQVKGVPAEDATRVAQHVSGDEEKFLRAIAAERLNSTEEALSNPYVSALSGSLSTAVGAFIPILPFFFLNGIPAVIAAAIISLIAHFAVGAAKSMITVRSWWSSGLEMTIVGAVEGAVTYAIGLALGGVGA